MNTQAIRWTGIGAAVLALLTLTACVAPMPVYRTYRYPYQPAAYPMAAMPGPAMQQYGRVAQIEVIRSQTAGAPPSGAGVVTGGVIGGALGNQFGHGSGRAAATALGVIGGALLGNSIEANANGPRVYESFRVSIQTDDGGYRVFDVPHPGDLRVGDRVFINNGQISRL